MVNSATCSTIERLNWTCFLLVWTVLIFCLGSDVVVAEPTSSPWAAMSLGDPTVDWCSLQPTAAHVEPPVSKYAPPQAPRPRLETRTCEVLYGDLACCSRDQTENMKYSEFMITMEALFAPCPACVHNLWALWCGYACSPSQAEFVFTTEQGPANEALATNFTVNPLYAETLYNSCKDVIMNNKSKMSDVFPDYSIFFNWIFENYGKYYEQITVVYSSSGSSFSNDLAACSDSCDCNNCEDACHPKPNLHLKLNNTYPTIGLFNGEWTYLSVGLGFGYLIALFGFFFSVSIWLICFKANFFSAKKRILATFIMMGIVIALLGVAAGISDHWRTECTITVFNADWNCSTFGIVTAMVFITLATPFGVSLAYYFLYRTRSTDHVISESGSTKWLQKGSFLENPLPKGQLQRYFHIHGRICAKYAAQVILICLVITGLCSIGLISLEREDDPQKLWVGTSSRSIANKNYYDKYFGSLVREETMIVTHKDSTSSGSMVTLEVLQELYHLQQTIINANTTWSKQEASLSDLCYKPVPGKGCMIHSPLELFQNNLEPYKDDQSLQDHIKFCTENNNSPSCLSSLGVPVDMAVVFGGLNKNEDYYAAGALIVTILIMDQDNQADLISAWEDTFLDIASKSYNFLKIRFSAESSFQKEVHKQSLAGVPAIAISYCVMFVYISLAIGRILPIRNMYFIVDSKFVLGFCIVLMVIGSLTASLGICSIFRVKETLEVNLVIPFLLLAIAVDNIFVLVETYERTDPSFGVQERVAEALSQVGSSMALASLSESLAFFVGMMIDITAVQAFSLYAAVAVLYNFLLQITCFVSILTLDALRAEQNRVDCFPCVQLKQWTPDDDYSLPLLSRKKNRGLLRAFARKYYAPCLLHPVSKIFVIFTFIAMLLVGIHNATEIDVGLDERDFLPADSYLIEYLQEQTELKSVGPEVYIVLKGFDYSDSDTQDKVCSYPGCPPNSLMNWFHIAPYMANNSSFSWLDSYLNWASQDSCCLFSEQTQQQCFGPANRTIGCEECFSLNEKNRPEYMDQFNQFLPFFLNGSQTQNCGVIGKQFAADVIYDAEVQEVVCSRLRLRHSALRNNADKVNALKTAYQLVRNSKLNAFAYSKFYMFTEEYLYIRHTAALEISITLAGIFGITLLILGNPVIALVIVLVIAMIEINMLGAMKLWGLDLNGISLINVLTGAGISIEFCVHIAHAFSRSSGTKQQRAFRSLVEMFGPVFSGVTLTKLLGLLVLAISQSMLIREYYFVLYCMLLVLGALHGLVFLPVVLSLVGTDRGAFCMPQKYQYAIEIGGNLVEPL